MAWYNPAWSYALPVTVTNGSSTSAVSYAQVAIPLTGAAYTAITTHGQAGLADIVVTDSDGVTPLPFALEGIDTTNSAVHLLAKVSLAASGSRTVYVYYGNPAATSQSSYPGAVRPQVALSGPTDIVTQTGGPINVSSGYNSNPKLVLLKNQTGATASKNGDLLAPFIKGANTNGGQEADLGMLRCPAGSDPRVAANWTMSVVIAHVAGNGALALAAAELADGSILLVYEYDTDANVNAAKGKMYVARSTDAGVTWTNASTSPTAPITLPNSGVYGTTVGLFWSPIFQDAAGNIYMTWYGTPPSDTATSSYLMKCLAASSPVVGSNWAPVSTIARDSAQSLGYSEPTVFPITSTSWLAIMRNEGASPNTGDLYRCSSADGGTTWGAVTAMGLPSAGHGGGVSTAAGNVAPELSRLASGNILLRWGLRNSASVEAGSVVYGDLCALSTDGGVSFFDRYFAMPADLVAFGGGDYVTYGVGTTAQLADGSIVMLSYRPLSSATATNQANIFVSVFTEDWIVNSGNVYDNCEALGTQWTHGATATVSTTHVHNGTNAIKMDNQAGTGSYAYLTPWPNPCRSAGKVAVSVWTYATQIASRGCSMIVADNPVGSGNPRFNTTVDATPYRAIWYNGSAYQDATTGLIAGINAWYKLTDYFSVPANSGKILVNDVLSQGAQTQYGTGNNPKLVEWLAASAVTGGALDTWWIDDVQVHQYLPALPTIAVGAELASLGVSISPAAWAIATYPVAPTLTLTMAKAPVVIATGPVTTTVIPGGITVGMSAAAMGITTFPVTTTWTAPGATTAFRQHANLALSTLAAAYTAGAGSVQLQPGDGVKFGTPSLSHPLAVVVSQVATAFTPHMDRTNSTIYLATGVTGDTLALTATEGTTDRNYALGDYLFCSPTAADLDAMATAINALEARSAAIPSPGGHAGQYLGTDGTVMSWSVVPLLIGQPITGGAAYENGLLLVDASGNLGCAPSSLWYDQIGGILHVPSYQGEGSQINNLNATQLLLGTVPAARLPAPTATALGGVRSAAAVAHQWLNSISTAGVPGLSQPAFADITGVATPAQLPTVGLVITQHSGAIIVPAGTSGTITCDLSAGDYFAPAALTGATTFAFSNPPASGKQAFVLEVIPGGFAITWPGTVAWPGGTAPTPTATAGKVDMFGFVYNATAAKYRGSVINQNY